MTTKIEWADKTWNPITGCSRISDGCDNCYAERMAKRLAGRFGYRKDKPFSITAHVDKFNQPKSWKKPCRIFVCSMGDLFHPGVPDDRIDDVLSVTDEAPRHTYIFLTKRPKRMLKYFQERGFPGHSENVWLGVTAENQRMADIRIPLLLQIPATVRFVSVEPMLEPVSVRHYLSLFGPKPPPCREAVEHCGDCKVYGRACRYGPIQQRPLEWILCGAETGSRRRGMSLSWATALRDQCIAAGTPFFFKKDSRGRGVLDRKAWHQFPNNGR